MVYTTTPALPGALLVPEYSTNPPPVAATEISKSSLLAGEAAVPSVPTTLATVRFFFTPSAASASASGGGARSRRQQQKQGALRQNRSKRMNATATRPSASAVANMSG